MDANATLVVHMSPCTDRFKVAMVPEATEANSDSEGEGEAAAVRILHAYISSLFVD